MRIDYPEIEELVRTVKELREEKNKNAGEEKAAASQLRERLVEFEGNHIELGNMVVVFSDTSRVDMKKMREELLKLGVSGLILEQATIAATVVNPGGKMDIRYATSAPAQR
jgi:L-2-hydroxyglutarate oxidase LhgO